MNKDELINYLKNENFSKSITDAFFKIKREDFIPHNLERFAYENEPLPIGEGQTISQPYTIAFMLDILELKDNQKILEVGSGGGYVLKLISEISQKSEIYGIERIRSLAEKSRQVLLGLKNIKVYHMDGANGILEKAPFDRILVSASAKSILNELVNQLKDGGILVCPLHSSIIQIKKVKGVLHKKEFPGFIFVPLLKGKV